MIVVLWLDTRTRIVCGDIPADLGHIIRLIVGAPIRDS
jgi:hypothetical protein